MPEYRSTRRIRALLSECRTHSIAFFYLITLLGLSSCTSVNKNSSKRLDALNENLSIVILGDSQIVGEHARQFNGSIWSNKYSDILVDVTMRTPIQNEFAVDGLKILLEKSLATNPDIILYLGDGANHGCRNELVSVLDTLRTFQNEVPIFFLIGNHDYLAAGNTPDKNARNTFCPPTTDPGPGNSNPNALSKFDAIELAHHFNQIGKENLPENITFEDNFHEDLREICNNRFHQDEVRTCFYSGYIQKNKTGVVLLDTSNYDQDIASLLSDVRFRGLYGSVCCNTDSIGQWQWLTGKTHQLDNIIFASHYPPQDLLEFNRYLKAKNLELMERGWGLSGSNIGIHRMEVSKINRTVEPLLRLIPLQAKVYWLSAHTHLNSDWENVPIKRTVDNPREHMIQSINVGSTTDFPQHAISLKFSDSDTKLSKIYLSDGQDDAYCNILLSDICNGNVQFKHLETISGFNGKLSSFGFTKEYRNWNSDDFSAASRNLSSLRDVYDSDDSAKACFLDFAAKQEKGVESSISCQ
ncbi:MAG: metallophosphoesterase [Pseudomonadota bacterium]|nr:metallophosphoesterase [Pseudomonadota bacterium]